MKPTIQDLNNLLDKLDRTYWDRLSPADRAATISPIAELHGEIQELFYKLEEFLKNDLLTLQ